MSQESELVDAIGTAAANVSARAGSERFMSMAVSMSKALNARDMTKFGGIILSYFAVLEARIDELERRK